MARNRPGKRERLEAKRNAFQEARAAIIKANLEGSRPSRPVAGSPRGFGNSTLARDNLKAGSHNTGFIGPRGFKTPRDMIQPLKRDEISHGILAGPRSQREREAALALAALGAKKV
jgi:hypothetical protein